MLPTNDFLHKIKLTYIESAWWENTISSLTKWVDPNCAQQHHNPSNFYYQVERHFLKKLPTWFLKLTCYLETIKLLPTKDFLHKIKLTNIGKAWENTFSHLLNGWTPTILNNTTTHLTSTKRGWNSFSEKVVSMNFRVNLLPGNN